MHNDFIKQTAYELGADLVGIAPIDRFSGAPAGFHPCDILPTCQSVIVLASEFPPSSLHSDPADYTSVRNNMVARMDRMAQMLDKVIKSHKADSRIIRSTTTVYAEGRYRGPISLKHAGQFAGLGKIGQHTLLTNNRFGNMIWLSAVLTSAELEADPLADYEVCLPECTLCENNCPAGALGNPQIKQLKCYNHAFKHVKGCLEIQCWQCRRICPYKNGIPKPSQEQNALYM